MVRVWGLCVGVEGSEGERAELESEGGQLCVCT